MKYNWYLAMTFIFIMTIMACVFSFGDEENADAVTDTVWETGLENVVPAWNMERVVQEAQANKEYNDKVDQCVSEMIATMSLEQKLAQMMILTNENDITATTLSTYQPGGIILFSKDFEEKTVEQVAERIKGLQSDVEIPLFIGVDEEGGDVSRVAGMQGDIIPEFQSARQLYEAGGSQTVYEDTMTKTAFLASMGVNLNFAPVADVVKKKSSYMYERSASGESEEVADYVETVVTVMKQQHMGSCLKHFPGYGENANTHQVYTVDRKALSAYRDRDFIPFYRGIAAGADMLMVSHIVMKAVDETNPASLSPAVHSLLRDELEFEGVIMADDLNMRAILSQMTLENAAEEAFLAGNDMVFSADFLATMRGAKRAAEGGRLSVQQIDESVTRIMKMKINQGLITIPEGK